MRLSIVKFAVISFALLLSGCAGTNFVRVTNDELILGQTTQQQVKSRLGSPYREGVVVKNDQQLKTASYAYAASDTAAEGAIAARSQGFYFFNEQLVGYEFTSSWKEDSTDFDSGKVSQIKKGESTKTDVMRLLGTPGGKYIYPVIPNNSEEAVNYLYQQGKGTVFNLKFLQKLLVVTFSKQGVVTNVEYTEWEQK